MQCHGVILILTFAIVTVSLKIFEKGILETMMCRKLKLSEDIGWGVGVQCHGLALI